MAKKKKKKKKKKSFWAKLPLPGKIMIIVLTLAVIGLSVFYFINANKEEPVTEEWLINGNMGRSSKPSKTALKLSMDFTGKGNYHDITIADTLDYNTDKLSISFPDSNIKTEAYVENILGKMGIYYKKTNEEMWTLLKKPKNTAVDNGFTEFIEVDKSTTSSNINYNSFEPGSVSFVGTSSSIPNGDKTHYIVKGSMKFSKAFQLLGNGYQCLFINDNYKNYAVWLTKYGDLINMSVKMYFNRETNLLDKIVMESDDDDLKLAILNLNNNSEKEFAVYHFKAIYMVEDQASIDNIIVPRSVEANLEKTIEIFSLITNY